MFPKIVVPPNHPFWSILNGFSIIYFGAHINIGARENESDESANVSTNKFKADPFYQKKHIFFMYSSILQNTKNIQQIPPSPHLKPPRSFPRKFRNAMDFTDENHWFATQANAASKTDTLWNKEGMERQKNGGFKPSSGFLPLDMFPTHPGKLTFWTPPPKKKGLFGWKMILLLFIQIVVTFLGSRDVSFLGSGRFSGSN